MDSERTRFDGMDKYLLSFTRYSRIDSLTTEKKTIIYRNSVIHLEVTDTIKER